MVNPSSVTIPTSAHLEISNLQAFVLRWPVRNPVRTSFGVMHDRPAVFVRVEDTQHNVGWGEIWCNFPSCGAEHRANLLATVLAPIVQNQSFSSPLQAYELMHRRTAILALQSGESGPLAQVIAGIDLAFWDLISRRAGQPLWAYLGGTHDQIKVYASGINPDQPTILAKTKFQEGYRAFKVKVGFGEDLDLANVAALRSVLPKSALLMVDANQAWDTEQAIKMADKLASFDLHWIEEPIPADSSIDQWLQLARCCPIPLAAGENILGFERFESMITSRALQTLQPDLAKWGGLSGCLPVIQSTLQNGLNYCPHYLGAGVGLMASAHVMAALGNEHSMLEIDANENPLRTQFATPLQTITDGYARLGNEPGIGVTPSYEQLAAFTPGLVL